jgi:ketosteroid isomerase-like protein
MPNDSVRAVETATGKGNTMNNVEIVKYIYEKFKHGDTQSILATYAPDIEFRLAEGHPYQPSGHPWFGKDAITQHFFSKAVREWDWSIALANVHDLGDTVVVEGRYKAVFRPTGKALDAQTCHVWKFKNGMVMSFHQYADTAQIQDVMTREHAVAS